MVCSDLSTRYFLAVYLLTDRQSYLPFRIDLLTQISGISYEEVANSARTYRLDGIDVPVISPQALLRNKLAAGRPKDLADAEELQRMLDMGID